ncbi:hypothetical protein [Lactococcus lactis]|uniref:hypothetical protein n=1 Tax=Lactococcus lactis TaxID=1358 RepID=UPI0024A81BE3|nr:hypothetical protein [Lactococcus lactis]
MNEEKFNRIKRMFLKRLADNFWYDGQWKFSHTLKKNHQFAREQRSRVTQALRRCVTREIFPTANILKMLTDYFTAEELADIAEARIVQEERLREEKRQHMKILGTVRSAKRQRLTNLMIEPKTEVILPKKMMDIENLPVTTDKLSVEKLQERCDRYEKALTEISKMADSGDVTWNENIKAVTNPALVAIGGENESLDN